MKTNRTSIAKKARPSICTSTIATAILVLTQVGSFAPSASADTSTVVLGDSVLGGAIVGPDLLKLGGGTTYLDTAAPGLTGVVTGSQGSLVVTNSNQLGTASVVITGGATAGALDGNLTVGGGITILNPLSLRGQGLGGQSYALTNVGDNTYNGSISTGTGAITRVTSTYGTGTFGAASTVALAQGQTFQLAGNANWLQLAGSVISGGSTAALQKSGTGSLELQGTNTYGGVTTISGGFLRASSGSNFGANTGAAAITLQGATLELRTNTSAIDKSITHNGGNGSIFVDHSVGGTLQNQTVTFDTLTQDANRTTTLNGRNGYGVSFNSVGTAGQSVIVNQAGNSAITNNLAGLVTYNGNFWNTSNTTGRTFTLDGNGNSVINGNIIANGTGHNFTKAGTGTLTLASGTGSNLQGVWGVNGGTLAISSITALNNAATGTASRINLNGGTLSFIGSGAASDYVVAKTVNLAANGTLSANQSVVNPVVISDLTVLGDAARTLTLTGSNGSDNLISGAITNATGTGAGVVSLTKAGTGTWAISGANTYTGNTTIQGGTLKVLANALNTPVISGGTSGNVVFNTNGGTLDLVGAAATANTQNLGQLVPTAGAATVKITPGAGGGSMAVSFLATGTATTGLGAVNNASSVNIVNPGGAGNTVTIAGLPDGFIDPHITYNGSNFAVATGGSGLLAAADYTQPGFATSATVLTNAVHNEITGSFTQLAAETIRSLKINGGQTLTLNGLLTINSQGLTTGATSAGGILQTGGAGTITGSGISTGTAGNLTVRVDGVGDSLTLASPIQATGGGLTKNGAGLLILSGANAQSGATTINEGTLQLSGAGVLSANNANMLINSLGTLDLNGVSTGTRIGQLNGAGTVTNSNAAAAVLTIGNNNQGGTFSGVIQDGVGQISLVKQGTANQTWSGLNTYTGTTTINSTGVVTVGTLVNGGLASGIGASSNAAENLVFNGSGNANGATAGLSYNGAAATSTDRLFTLAGNVNNGGGRIQSATGNASSLVYSNTGAIVVTGTGTKNMTFGGASTGDNIFNPQLVNGTGTSATAIVSVVKDDAGLWRLANAANSYTGSTTIRNGMLEAQDGTSLPTASSLVIGNSATGTATATAIFQSSGNFGAGRTLGANLFVGTGTGGNHNAGFAASSAKLNVNIGTATWGTPSFMAGNQALLLNSTTALAEVDYQSAIDLNGGVREIQVLDNGNAGTDLATVSGVISNGSLTKNGAGILQLTNDNNSYAGNTLVRQGVLRVTSLGVGGNSSVGAAGGTVQLGINATGGILEYIGSGENSARAIDANGTSGATATIRSSGSGRLILTNVTNSVSSGTATKTITLGGENSGPNEVTSALADNGGPLAVTKADGGVWTLSGPSTYTGTTTVTSGLLGIGAASTGTPGAVTSGPLGTGLLTFGGGSIFADGAPRTILNTVAGAGTGQVMGEFDLTLTNINAGGTINNVMLPGNTMFVTGTIASTGTGAATATIGGTGNTVINGLIANGTSGGATNLTYAGSGKGTLDLSATITTTGNITVSGGTGNINSTGAYGNLVVSGGTANLNIAQTNTGVTTLSGGVMNVNVVNAINPANVLNLNGGTLQAATDAAGVITNAVTLGGNPTMAGTSTIQLTGPVTLNANRTMTNNIASPKQLLLDGPVNLGSGTAASFALTLSGSGNTQVNGLISNGGTSGGGVTVNTGTAAGFVSLNNGGNSYTGVTTLTAGNLNVGAAGAISTAGSSLNLNGGVLTASSVAAGSIGNLVLLGGTATVAGSNTIQFAGNVINNGGNRVLNNNITGVGNELLLSGGVQLAESTTSGRTLTLGGTGNTRTTAAIVNGGTAATGSALVKAGTGTLQYDAVNTYTGPTTINAGTIKAGISGGLALGTSMTLNPNTIGGTATLDLNNNSLLTNGLTVSGSSGSISTVQTGTGTLGVTGVTYTVSAINNPLGATISGNLSLGTATRTFTIGNSTATDTELDVTAVVSRLSGTAGVTKTGLGTMSLSNVANNYNGVTTVNQGILKVTKLADGGIASSIGSSSAAVGNLVLSGTNGPGILEYTGSGDPTNRLFTIGGGTGGATISNTGSGPVNFTGTGVLTATGTANRTFTLTGTNGGGNNVLTPSIGTSAGVITLVKSGTNTWDLAAAAGNAYTGPTIINGGTLLANNTTGSATGTGPVTVNTGGTLGGSGIVTGAITLAGGTVSPGNSIGTLSGTSADLSNGTLKIEINSSALTSDKLSLSSGLTLGGVGSNLLVTDLGSAVLALNTKLTIATYGSLSGLFSVGGNVLNDVDTNPFDVFTVGLNVFGIDYNDGGNSIALVAVPEPGTIGSLIGGFGVLLGLRRRKSRRA